MDNSKLQHFQKKIYSFSAKINKGIMAIHNRAKAIESYYLDPEAFVLSDLKQDVLKIFYIDEDLVGKKQFLDVSEAKKARNCYVSECNMLAANIVQFDNIVEQFFIYLTQRDGRVNYKDIVLESGISEENWLNVFFPIRTLRNTMCHSYAFHTIFSDMKINKIGFLRYAFKKAKDLSIREILKERALFETSCTSFLLFLKNDKKIVKSKKTHWFVF